MALLCPAVLRGSWGARRSQGGVGGSSQWRRRALSLLLPHVGCAAVRGPEQRADTGLCGRATRGGPNDIYCVRCAHARSGAAPGLVRAAARLWSAHGVHIECLWGAYGVPGSLNLRLAGAGVGEAWSLALQIEPFVCAPAPSRGSTRRSLSGPLLVSSTKVLPGRK